MIKKNRLITGTILAVLLLWGIFFVFKNIAQTTGKTINQEYDLEKFVKCLNDKQIFLYGFQNDTNVAMQLSVFQEYAQNISVVDCNNNLEKCEGIIVYPTWNINDILIHGSLSLNILSRFSGCSLN
ncbi:hypothetical protein KA107_01885 [Candidatus Pacearchaeota archaeon]|nr:hypothetical protein [Candidatus Pacearchaeota archaeon]